MPYGILLEAEYEDGYILTEDEQDQSPFDSGKNIFNAIVNSRPCEEHGPMVRWSLVTPKHTYNIDWAKIVLQVFNPRIIYHRQMQSVKEGGSDAVVSCLGHVFGYQYNRPDGSNAQETIVIEA